VLVATREGRPVKLEGNREHPASLGGLGLYGQAALMSLYDPDRLRSPSRGGKPSTWGAADAEIREALAGSAAEGRAILVITPALVSPSYRSLLARFTEAYPTARHLAVEMFHSGEALVGHTRVLGARALPHVDWGRADVVLCVEDDFLGSAATAGDQLAYGVRRCPDAAQGMNRLWCAEGAMSATGSSADHRLPVRPSLLGKLLLGLLHGVVVERSMGPLASDAEVARLLAPYSPGKVAREAGLSPSSVGALVDDLTDHPSRSAVLVGNTMPASLHALGAALNFSLGNVGTSLGYSREKAADVASDAEVAGAVGDLSSGDVGVAIVLGANPAYVLPNGAAFGEALGRAGLVASSSMVADEMAQAADWVLPAAHDLEAWGDVDCHAGALTLQQPTMESLFGARQYEASLLAWLPNGDGPEPVYSEFLRRRWQEEVQPGLASTADFSRFWAAALHEGFVAVRGDTDELSLDPDGVRSAISEAAQMPTGGTDVMLAPSPSVYDGRFSNNGWLQETPHPITSHVWGNGALMGQATAQALGCADGDGVAVTVGGRSVSLPAITVPGVPEGVVQVSLGYGRTHGGTVGSGVGVDAGRLRAAAGRLSPWVYTGAGVTVGEGRLPIARTQEHHGLHGRTLVVEGTAAQYAADRAFAQAASARDTSASPGGWDYATGQKWAMAIDLSKCTGCNACVVACMAENNVPVVGPEQVARGREMHWVRVDHYYRGSAEDPEGMRVVHQPMLCQHCDNAPCENVCPVAATTHSSDGLNEMTYNRCVGTRYCAINCPYKVRRFNYFDNHEGMASPEELRHNPEVTVRSRGVMEKCTFCVQRIRSAQQAAKREDRALADGEAMTACQQACPSGAIVFGDVNDPASRAHALAQSPRGYHVLGELGVRPAITYLAKIRNPHPDVKV